MLTVEAQSDRVLVARDAPGFVPIGGSVAVECGTCGAPCWLAPSSPRDAARVCVDCMLVELTGSLRMPRR